MTDSATAARVIVREFSGHRTFSSAPVSDVACEESQAALRQFSLERLMGYGVHHADAVELRGRVWAGESWQAVATSLADVCLAPAEAGVSAATPLTRANRLLRASALLRMGQMMLLRDSLERRRIVERAHLLFEEAAVLLNDREPLTVETAGGPLSGWLYPSHRTQTLGRAVVIGGVEGWAMDFADQGLALAARGVETLVLDGPGQGVSRMIHGHFLSASWARAYSEVFDALDRRGPALPIAFVGNSMGGAVAMHLASRDRRIAACCNNGGHPVPGRPRGETTFARKMAAHVGDVSLAASQEVWASIEPVDPNTPVRCALLVVHGGQDPMIALDDSRRALEAAASTDKQMVVFSDGDHCLYNHADDKHALIGDWVASRLAAASGSEPGAHAAGWGN